jgi:hypothetical protein
LSIGEWTQILDNDSGSVFVRITDISGAAAPYTITCNDGLIDLSAYTVAQNARTWGSCSVVDPVTLEVSEVNGGWQRGHRGSRIVVNKKNTTLETLSENLNDVLFRIWYTGVAASSTMTISVVGGVKKLTTNCAGVAADNLDITISNYTTIQQLVDYINNFGGGTKYQCYSDYYNAGTYNPIYLDFYNAINIKAFPLDVKAAVNEVIDTINTYSDLVVATSVDNVYGQLETISSTNKRFFAGASNGGTANSYVQAGFDALLNEECDIVVPLFSRDALSDIADALTDATSTYTIASIMAMTDSHCRTASSTLNRAERLGWIAYKNTFENSKTVAKVTNSEYVSLVIQDCQVSDASGTMTWKNPHIFAALNAGMEAGSVIGMPLTKKALNCNGIRHSDFNPKTQYSQAIDCGIYFAEQPPKGGVVVVCANTTYQKDSSFVFNRRSVMRAANYTATTLREQLESAFVGKTKATGTTLANGVKSYAQSILGTLLRNEILVGDARNDGMGYRELAVSVNGAIVTLSVIITPVQGIDFVLSNITLANINDIA